MPAVARHSQVYNFLASAYHFALPDSHPFHTLRAWAFGTRINECQNNAVLQKGGRWHEYREFASPLADLDPRYSLSALRFTRGWFFYDDKRDETIVRARGLRERTEHGTENVEAVADGKTFVFDGKIDTGIPVTNSHLGLLRFKRALERGGYKIKWTGWKDFDIKKDGDNFGVAFRDPFTNELIYCFTSIDKPYQMEAAKMAKERGFKSEHPKW